MKKLSITKMADTIIAKRKEQKLTQAQLAEMTGINRGIFPFLTIGSITFSSKKAYMFCFDVFL